MSDWAPVVVVLSERGRRLAERLRDALPGMELHGPAGRVGGVDLPFQDFGDHVQRLFAAGRPVVGVSAAGILIRAVAPELKDKRIEPAVIAVAEDGSAVVPLLGGHQGGNRLAVKIGDALGARASITTASEAIFGHALDDPPPGWRIANPSAAKAVAVALRDDRPVRLTDDLPPELEREWLPRFQATDDPAAPAVHLTERAVADDRDTLLIRPETLAVGVGCERGAPAAAVMKAIEMVLADGGFAQESVACVATIDLKEDEPGIRAAAAALGVPLVLFRAAELEAETSRLANPSDYVYETVGCHGVAEAAALAVAGPDAMLVVPKRIEGKATGALARSPQPIEPGRAGRLAGSLTLVGIGPGDATNRTPEATNALSRASDIVGYTLYLDLVGGLTSGKTCHGFPLGSEIERADHALALAADGRAVALVCSGDAGIYAMASLVFERMERTPSFQRLAIQVVPGISAMQAAAARAGAPLGNDFCAISLSDLLTPWKVIESRLRAAATANFVVALYNPASTKRRDHLTRAVEILRAHRDPGTPVVVARNVGREKERTDIVRLGEFHEEQVDMLTLVIVGNRETRTTPGPGGRSWVYTPRGYKAKEPAR